MQKFSSLKDVAASAQNHQRVLIANKDVVYDLTQFANRHPGGREVLLSYKGKQIEDILFNPQYHRHNHSVLNILNQYKCGQIVENNTQNQDSKSTNQAIIKISNNSVKPNPSSTLTEKKQVLKSKSPLRPAPLTIPKRLISKSVDKQISSPKQQTNDLSVIQLKNEQVIKSSTMQESKNKFVPRKSQLIKQNSFSDSNIVRSSSIPQYLTIPSPKEVLIQQKVKQQKMIIDERQKKQEYQKSIEADVKTQSEIIFFQQPKTTNSFYEEWKQQGKTQSEIIITQKSKITNSFYEQWKQQQDQQKLLVADTYIIDEELILHQDEKVKIRKVNSYYLEWQSRQHQATIQEQEEESLCNSPHLKHQKNDKVINRTSSAYSGRSGVEEEGELQLIVPILKPKLLQMLKCKNHFS